MTSAVASRHAYLIAGVLMISFFFGCVRISAAAVPAYAAPDKKDKQQGRLLYGKVLDQKDNPVINSVVYLTNMRTHAVKSYIVGEDGTYRFPGLGPVDYEVYAQYNGHKSDTKSLSQFDDRSQVYVDLKISTQ